MLLLLLYNQLQHDIIRCHEWLVNYIVIQYNKAYHPIVSYHVMSHHVISWNNIATRSMSVIISITSIIVINMFIIIIIIIAIIVIITELDPSAALSWVGWLVQRYQSNTADLFHACFIVSIITIVCYITRHVPLYPPVTTSMRSNFYSRECLGHHRKGTPGIVHCYYALNVG